ncbi:hypothetical protein BKA80DRAFT_263923 [Phyllosticta citrichinensis]
MVGGSQSVAPLVREKDRLDDGYDTAQPTSPHNHRHHSEPQSTLETAEAKKKQHSHTDRYDQQSRTL